MSVFGALVAALLAACGAPAADVRTAPPAAVVATSSAPLDVDRVFNPAEHRAEDVTVEARGVLSRLTAPTIEENVENADSLLGAPIDTTWDIANGYRIQIYTSATREQADAAAERAQLRFPYDSVYVYFSAPFHRVRVGDLQTRQAADDKMTEARAKGYRDAFLIPSEIRLMRIRREGEAESDEGEE